MKFILRPLLAVLTLVAIANQLVIHVRVGASVVNFFSYFTNLSNLLAAAVLLLTGRPWPVQPGPLPAANDQLRVMSATNMAVVGIVFTLLLRNEDLGNLLPWVNFVLHDLMPCAVVLDWLLDPPSSRLRTRHLLQIFIYPAAYLAYTLIRGAQTGWYPYPFLNPAHAAGYGAVAGYAAGITVLFLLLGWLLATIGNRRSAPYSSSPDANG